MNGPAALTVLSPDTATWETCDRIFRLRCKTVVSDGTLELYERHLRLFHRWLEQNGNPRPCETKAGNLRAYLVWKKAQGIRDATVDVSFRILKTYFGHLTKEGLLWRDPTQEVQRPRREQRIVRGFTEAELKAVLEQIPKTAVGARDRAIIMLGADSGARISEILGLRLSVLDLANSTAVVQGKGNKQRAIVWGSTTRAALLEWLKHRGPAEASEPVFITQHGRALSRLVFAARFKRYTRRAGVAEERLSFHALRHAFAGWALKHGLNVEELRLALGHASVHQSLAYARTIGAGEAMAKARAASPIDRMARTGLLPGVRRVVVK